MKKRSFWLALIVLTLIFTACTDSNSLTSEADGDGAPNGDEDISDGDDADIADGDDPDVSDGDTIDGDDSLPDGDGEDPSTDGDAESGAAIDIQPTELFFGVVPMGENSDRELKISSEGVSALDISSVTLSPETSEAFSIVQQPETHVASGEETSAIIRYQPRVEGELQGELIIVSNAGNTPTLRVPISAGRSLESNVILDPVSLDFSYIFAGRPQEKYTLAKNLGLGMATIESVQLADDGGGVFRIASIGSDGELVSRPFYLDGGNTVAIYIEAALSPGAYAVGDTYTGQLVVTVVESAGHRKNITADLHALAGRAEGTCIDIIPRDGSVGFGGFGNFPGPGIDFGYVDINTISTREVVISNCGDSPLAITQMTWQNSFLDNPPMTPRAFHEALDTFADYTLELGETVTIEISFSPTQNGTLYSSAFYMATNAETYAWIPAGEDVPHPTPENPWDVKIGLQGTGTVPQNEILPSFLDFGMVTVDCCSRPQELTVYNLSERPQEVWNLAIRSDSDAHFELASAPNLPLVIGGSDNPQSVSFEVRYCAETEGLASGDVEIGVRDEQNEDVLSVSLSGEGTSLMHQRDEYQQVTHPMIDVLFVVDCSGSMGDEIESIAQNFETFINIATTWNTDMHIAIISCDLENPDHNGKFQGTPTVIKYGGQDSMSQQEVIDRFRSNIDLDDNCDSAEAGLEASRIALSSPLIEDFNSGFLREDAKLSIIFVSDEEDQSMGSVPFYIDFFRSIKGAQNVGMLEVYAIVGDDPNGCSGDSGDAGPGSRYIHVADACNSHNDQHFMSICSEDFTPVYENIAENVFALRNQFFLSRLADPATISVMIDGRTDTSWEYDEASISIVFPESNSPAPGSRIEVEYDTLCLE